MRFLRDITRRWRLLNANDLSQQGVLARERRRQERRRLQQKRRQAARVRRLFVFALVVAAAWYYLRRRTRRVQPLSGSVRALAGGRLHANAVAPPPRHTANPVPAVAGKHLHHAAGKEAAEVAPQKMFSRRCWHSREAGDAVCALRPLCSDASGAVYVGDRLECVEGTSAAQCAGILHAAEVGAEMTGSAVRPDAWLAGLDSRGKVAWFEGASVVLRLGRRSFSVVQYAHRVLMLHHVLRHPARYGLTSAPANVILVADEPVLRKIRFTKSWHHWLLAAVVHPNALRLQPARQAIKEAGKVPAAGEIRVLTATAWAGLAPTDRRTPCMRQAVVASGLRATFFLERPAYPAVGPASAAADERATGTRPDGDAAAFRAQVYAATGRAEAPVKRRIVYLHRAHTRALEVAGSARLEGVLAERAHAAGFAYTLVDIEGLPFSSVLEAVGDAGVIVGVHGTQLLASLFLGRGAALVEILPYQFVQALYARPAGAAVKYASHSVVSGTDFVALYKYADAAACQTTSPQCRAWYRSDERPVAFGPLDAAKVGALVDRAIRHVTKHTAG